jgi:uncharacterized protein
MTQEELTDGADVDRSVGIVASKPVPCPTPETRQFWEGARRGELWLQRCVTTGRPFFYPRRYSPYLTGGETEWFQASGRARLHSYIIDERPPEAFGPGKNVIAVVELDEGPRMMTNIVDVVPDPEHLVLDMRLEVVFEPRGDWAVPLFRPALGEVAE